MAVDSLKINLTVDTEPFVRGLKEILLILWCVRYAQAYNRDTVRVVTAL